MLYLIEHDRETDRPKTRWGQFNGDILATIEALTIFCQCIDDISDIYLHDHHGNAVPLKEVCDNYCIKYKEKPHDN